MHHKKLARAPANLSVLHDLSSVRNFEVFIDVYIDLCLWYVFAHFIDSQAKTSSELYDVEVTSSMLHYKMLLKKMVSSSS